MPRQAHGRPLLGVGTSKPPKRKPQRNAALNALETAEKQNLDATKIRQHRLGEVEDDSSDPETRADADERSSKRRKITNGAGDEDEEDGGSDPEGGEWHTGVNDDDEDSDLDSDEAFGESDEEKFVDFAFRGSGAKSSKTAGKTHRTPRNIDLNEDMEEFDEASSQIQDDEEDDLGEGAVDLATAWDMDDADQHGTHKGAKRSHRLRAQESESEESDRISAEEADGDDSNEDEGEEDEDSESQFSISEDDVGGDIDGLRSFVEGLGTQGAKERIGTQMNGETNSSAVGSSTAKLSAADLLQYVKDPAQRQSLKILQSAEGPGVNSHKSGIPGKLSVPLAKRQQGRLDRSAAYEKSKETMGRWIDTVKQNRRAEHLSFPLADHAKESAIGQKQFIPTNQSTPLTDLESTINQIMQESGIHSRKGQSTEDQEQAFEELAEKKMDIDAVRARRAQLRMARELMFREEIRARRIKKIKSKAYRRVHRKEKDRAEAQQREALDAAGLLNSDDEREKNDRRRAEERMGDRHRESKWAKGVKQAGRTVWDEGARAGVSDLARRDEELRRRIEGKDVQESDGSDIEDDSDSDYDSDDQKMTEKLDALESSTSTPLKSKLGQMAFMQRAEAAQKAQNDEDIRQVRSALDGTGDGAEVGEDKHREPMGRQIFGARTAPKKPQTKKSQKKNEFEAPLSEDEDQDAVAQPEQDESVIRTSAAVQQGKLQSRSQTNVPGIKQGINTKTTGVPKSNVPVKSSAKQSSQSSHPETSLDSYTSPSESEHEDDADRAKAALAVSIFAGPDDEPQEFGREKAEVIEKEGDQIIDGSLPGWGSWTGAGIGKKEQKKAKNRFLKTVKGVAADQRRDAKLDRVIVNEKRVKKNDKYLATELPHPFETRQQYERSLRLPIGPEWSTASHYQDSIKPHVLLKQGTVIRPIARPTA